jgi:protein-disulfide isomerase
MNRWRILLSSLAVLAALASALAGCSGEGGPAAALLASAGPMSVDSAQQTTVDKRFNPFEDKVYIAPERVVIANPSLDEVMKPGPLPEMSLGRADAPVTIVEYASMTCPYCAEFQKTVFPQLKRDYIDKGKVRLILREFPIGFQSGAATIALRCAPPEKYFVLYDKLMAQQVSWVSMEVRTDPIYAVAKQVGMTRAQFDGCRENKPMIEALNAVKERGRNLGVIGTPNFFINGKLYKSTFDYAQLKAVIDPLIAGGSAPAGGLPKS